MAATEDLEEIRRQFDQVLMNSLVCMCVRVCAVCLVDGTVDLSSVIECVRRLPGTR